MHFKAITLFVSSSNLNPVNAKTCNLFGHASNLMAVSGAERICSLQVGSGIAGDKSLRRACAPNRECHSNCPTWKHFN